MRISGNHSKGFSFLLHVLAWPRVALRVLSGAPPVPKRVKVLLAKGEAKPEANVER
jgi:hypothetical protein